MAAEKLRLLLALEKLQLETVAKMRLLDKKNKKAKFYFGGKLAAIREVWNLTESI